jgi:hypothetical protein
VDTTTSRTDFDTIVLWMKQKNTMGFYYRVGLTIRVWITLEDGELVKTISDGATFGDPRTILPDSKSEDDARELQKIVRKIEVNEALIVNM